MAGVDSKSLVSVTQSPQKSFYCRFTGSHWHDSRQLSFKIFVLLDLSEVNFKVHFPVPYESEAFVRGYFKVWFGDVPEDKVSFCFCVFFVFFSMTHQCRPMVF